MTRALALPFWVSALLLGCSGGSTPVTSTPAAPPGPPPSAPAKPTATTTLEAVGLDPTAIDKSVDPCTDFYQFACGNWLARTTIPNDRSRWMRSFNEIHQANEQELRSILEAASGNTDDPATGKIGAFYKACMDEPAIEKAGTKPIDPLLTIAKSVRDPKSLSAAITELHRHGVWAVFSIEQDQDFKDATKVIAVIDQSGLGLPDRDYYDTGDQPIAKKKADELDESEKDQVERARTIREAYTAHVERMMALVGLSPAAAKVAASDVMKIETALAKLSQTRVERRSPENLYHKIDRDGVEKAAPHFTWPKYFESLGVPDLSDINVTNVAFLEGSNGLFASAKPREWQNYLSWQVVHAAAPALGKKFVDENFELTKLLSGQPENRPRWKRCVAATDDALGELLGQPYVARRFAGASKEAAERMVSAISQAFRTDLARLDWMDDETRRRAARKLAAMEYLIGYPDRWKTYEWTVGAVHAENVLRSSAYELTRELGKIGKPVDRKDWLMSPPTVNAYYHPLKNHMVFPAGILQPPFYSVKASEPVNLGAMGMVVGHELTHGFDDEGSKFDENGNLANWWGPGVRERFDTRTQCVEKQYAGFEALPGVTLNGKLTLGENIADLGGIKLAFAAHRALAAARPSETVAGGFTEDQQFFLGTAQAWCGKVREEEARMRVLTDPHSPPKDRVNGPLSNLPAFAEAFSCQPGSAMSPKDRCSVW